jgi:hypothetical protein
MFYFETSVIKNAHKFTIILFVFDNFSFYVLFRNNFDLYIFYIQNILSEFSPCVSQANYPVSIHLFPILSPNRVS